MTEKEIITTLEGIASERAGDFFYHVLDLINRKNVEIERLQEKNKEIAERVKQTICENTHPDFNKEGKPVNVWNARDGYQAIDNLCSEYGAK